MSCFCRDVRRSWLKNHRAEACSKYVLTGIFLFTDAQNASSILGTTTRHSPSGTGFVRNLF